MRFKLSFLIFIGCHIVYGANLEELLPNERNTVEIFQRFSPKVVYIHRLSTVTDAHYHRNQISAGAGSGIIWDNLGHIVTNYHVIHGASQLAVSIDRLTVEATVVGAEPRKDLAVLRIQSPKLLNHLKSYTPFELASTSQLLVGQKALAIGNPFGLDHSLSVGVISALGRNVPGIGGVKIRAMIQTDTSINPGNSGGPLLDSKGRLIGLNTAIYSNSGSSSGIGFAISADDIKRIVPEIIKNGRYITAGIGILQVLPNVAKKLGVQKGVLVAEVLPNTPAAKAGLQGLQRDHWGRIHLGDVITRLNGRIVNNYDALYNILSKIKVGETVDLAVIRNNQVYHLKVKTIDIGGY